MRRVGHLRFTTIEEMCDTTGHRRSASDPGRQDPDDDEIESGAGDAPRTARPGWLSSVAAGGVCRCRVSVRGAPVRSRLPCRLPSRVLYV